MLCGVVMSSSLKVGSRSVGAVIAFMFVLMASIFMLLFALGVFDSKSYQGVIETKLDIYQACRGKMRAKKAIPLGADFLSFDAVSWHLYDGLSFSLLSNYKVQEHGVSESVLFECHGERGSGGRWEVQVGEY